MLNWQEGLELGGRVLAECLWGSAFKSQYCREERMLKWLNTTPCGIQTTAHGGTHSLNSPLLCTDSY